MPDFYSQHENEQDKIMQKYGNKALKLAIAQSGFKSWFERVITNRIESKMEDRKM